MGREQIKNKCSIVAELKTAFIYITILIGTLGLINLVMFLIVCRYLFH